MDKNGCVLVSWDLNHGPDKALVIVGKKMHRKDAEIINAFQGEEAIKALKAIGNPHIPKINAEAITAKNIQTDKNIKSANLVNKEVNKK